MWCCAEQLSPAVAVSAAALDEADARELELAGFPVSTAVDDLIVPSLAGNILPPRPVPINSQTRSQLITVGSGSDQVTDSSLILSPRSPSRRVRAPPSASGGKIVTGRDASVIVSSQAAYRTEHLNLLQKFEKLSRLHQQTVAKIDRLQAEKKHAQDEVTELTKDVYQLRANNQRLTTELSDTNRTLSDARQQILRFEHSFGGAATATATATTASTGSTDAGSSGNGGTNTIVGCRKRIALLQRQITDLKHSSAETAAALQSQKTANEEQKAFIEILRRACDLKAHEINQSLSQQHRSGSASAASTPTLTSTPTVRAGNAMKPVGYRPLSSHSLVEIAARSERKSLTAELHKLKAEYKQLEINLSGWPDRLNEAVESLRREHETALAAERERSESAKRELHSTHRTAMQTAASAAADQFNSMSDMWASEKQALNKTVDDSQSTVSEQKK